MTDEFGQVREMIGELRGEMRGVVSSIDRLCGQVDETLRNCDAAHRAQDDRIATVKAEIAEQRGAWATSVRWTAMLSSLVGVIIGAASGFVQHLFRG